MIWKKKIIDDIWVKEIHTLLDYPFKCEITNLCGQFIYEIFIPEIDNKSIVNSQHIGKYFKKIASAKDEVEKIISHLKYCLENQKEMLWILKGVKLGFTELSEMEHLKD